MKLISTCLITALLTFLVGASADRLINPDNYKTRCFIDHRSKMHCPIREPPIEVVGCNLAEIHGMIDSSHLNDKPQRNIFKYAPAYNMRRTFRSAKKPLLKKLLGKLPNGGQEAIVGQSLT